MNNLVLCRGLVCRLGGRLVLDGLDLALDEGESLGLLGSSGSGKSTLLRIISGLEIPEAGEVFLSEKPATKAGRLLIPPHRRELAMLFQDLALWPNLTVAENVRLGLSGQSSSRRARQERIEEVLKVCGIEDLAHRQPGTLSGGQQQRVALARAIAVRPRLLLLDEPFAGLDLMTKERIVEQIAKLRADLGLALILVSHDPSEIRSLCNSLAVLEEGRILEHGSLQEISSNPRSDLARALGSSGPSK